MKSKITLKLLSLPCFIFPIINYAQSAIIPTGNNIKNGNGGISYTVGQIAYKSIESPTEKITQGVQQPYEIITLQTLESFQNKAILIYPNPVKDILYVDFNKDYIKNSNYQLFDGQGKLIKSEKISNQKSEINFSTYPTAIYILKIESDSKNIKTFKIIKKQ